ncbi:MAG: hypothetical protein R3E86_01620 [Pseudomonadales bacterium]
MTNFLRTSRPFLAMAGTRAWAGAAATGGARARRVPLLWITALLAAVAAPVATAEVTLTTTVHKVESVLDAGGNVERRLVLVDAVRPGDELRYAITVTNQSPEVVEGGRVVVTNPIPDGTEYLPGTAGGQDASLEFSADGETFTSTPPRDGDGVEQPARFLRWTYDAALQPGASTELFFHVRML